MRGGKSSRRNGSVSKKLRRRNLGRNKQAAAGEAVQKGSIDFARTRGQSRSPALFSASLAMRSRADKAVDATPRRVFFVLVKGVGEPRAV